MRSVPDADDVHDPRGLGHRTSRAGDCPEPRGTRSGAIRSGCGARRAIARSRRDAGVMLSTLAIGLAAGVGLYLFAIFATTFVLGVLLVIESIDPEPFSLFDLTITAKDSASLKESIEGVLRGRRIPFELGSTSTQ